MTFLLHYLQTLHAISNEMLWTGEMTKASLKDHNRWFKVESSNLGMLVSSYISIFITNGLKWCLISQMRVQVLNIRYLSRLAQ